MTSIAIVLFVIAAMISSVRLLLAPSLADRIIALDVTLVSFMGAIAAHAAHTDSTQFMILLVVLAIIGFTATVSAARFLLHEHIGPSGPSDPLNADPSAAGAGGAS